jgi:MYXO-CTERM domain-containing protein
MTTNIPYNSFYFQCTDIVLTNNPPVEADAGPTGNQDPDAGGGTDPVGDDAGVGGGDEMPSSPSGGCSTGGSSGGFFGLLLVGLTLWRRRS